MARRLTIFVGIALGSTLGCGEVIAQHALGDGTALDANQRVGSGGRNVRTNTFMQDLALRNAIVTGNAASGKSFRGSVGYESAGDFRGELGSDDIYAFQRDSFYSGLATTNVRGLSGLQYSMGQSVSGQSLDMFGQSLIVRRPGGGSTASGIDYQQDQSFVPAFDAFARTRGALRSTADYLSASYDSPTLLSLGRDDKGIERAQVASSLSGVKWIRQDNGLLSIGDPFRVEIPADGESEDTEAGFASPHSEIIKGLRLKADRIDLDSILPSRPEPDVVDPGDAGGDETGAAGEDALEARRREAMDRLLDAVRIEFEMRPPGEEEPETSEEDEASALDAETMRERTRRHLIRELTGVMVLDRPKIENLVFGDASKDLYTLHMSEGQRLLGDERWFDAEERFGHALKQRAGDPMAAAGRVHAQLGAGMILSGGKNLRDLFSAYPELVAARYAPDLLPSPEARVKIRLQLQDRIDRGTPVAAEAALLLAYLGYQSDHAESIRYGLDAIDRIRDEQQLDPDPMVALLRAAWTLTGE